jgi:hypothetical protein
MREFSGGKLKQKGFFHSVDVIEEHIRVFLLGLACKKKCIVRSRRWRISMFGAFSYSAKLGKNPPYLG